MTITNRQNNVKQYKITFKHLKAMRKIVSGNINLQNLFASRMVLTTN